MSEQEWLECTSLAVMTTYLRSLKGQEPIDPRKRRLVTCAIARLCTNAEFRGRKNNPTFRAVSACLATAEEFADDLRDLDDLQHAYNKMKRMFYRARHDHVDSLHVSWAAVSRTVFLNVAVIDTAAQRFLKKGVEAADVFRDVVGNPFWKPRPVYNPPEQYPGIACCPDEYIFLHAWVSEKVANLARTAYDNRNEEDFRLEEDRLLVLADALEDAGCPADATCRECHGRGWKWLNPDGRVGNEIASPCPAGCHNGRAPHEVLRHLRSGRHFRGCWAVDLLLGKRPPWT